MGVFKKLILGWIQVDRMMVMCWKRSVVIILDINEYGGLLLQDRVQKGLGKILRYQKVCGGWGDRGIRKGSSSAKNMRLNSHRFPIKDSWGHKASYANVAVINDIRKAYGLNLINFSSGSSGIFSLSFCAIRAACGCWKNE